jgi:ankyrin repeat protein
MRSGLPVFLAVAAINPAVAADVQKIRDSAEKGLALVQLSQKGWNRSCVSCHQQLLPALAFQAAREHGIKFDEVAARRQSERAFSLYANLDRAIEYTHIVDPAMDTGFTLLASSVSGVPPSLTTAVYARRIASFQESDGHWRTIDVRPPQSYSPLTATTVSLRALQLYSHKSLEADTKRRVERARQWLESVSAKTNEERSQQLLGAMWAGSTLEVRSKLAKELLEMQRPDGGWNSLNSLESDAYSTGLALVALADAGQVSPHDSRWQKGIDYLLASQKTDGSWHVVSRMHPPAQVSPPYLETGYPYGHDQFISSMGACYAVMALARALGPAGSAKAPALTATMPNTEPWMETALFGSAAELKAALDSKKLNPNAVTNGGITALMMAAPDVPKMTLLLAAGANADLRAKNRYSALLIASSYPNSEEAIQLLLKRGVRLRLPKDEGQPLFNMTSLMFASFARDSKAVKLLLEQGEKADEKSTLVGFSPTPPPIISVGFDDAASLTVMLDHGMPADFADDAGTTILSWAAIGNDLQAARLLIARGAKVNQTDSAGMTPLLYAASINFGDSAMIDLLLKSGANLRAKTKEGLSALDLAKKYGHTELVASLSH